MKTMLLKLAAVAAPLWFGLVVFVAGAFTPGYSQATQTMSELAAPGAPLGWLVRFGGFLPVGIILLVLALAIYRLPLPARTGEALLLALAGAAIIMAGIFPTDFKGRRDSLDGLLHAIAGMMLLATACLAPLVSALRAAGSRGFRIFSFLTGISLTTLFVLTPNGISPGLVALHRQLLGNFFATWYKYYGIHQRAFMLIFFIWLVVFVQHIFSQPRTIGVPEVS